jgi:hypothetical protein
VVYHTILLIVTAYKPFQDNYWTVKVLLWFGSFIGSFFIPNEVLEKYWIACVCFSALFILIQLLILVDWACDWSEMWISKYEETQSAIYKWLLILSVVFSYSAIIATTVILYMYYSNCPINQFAITFNLVLSLIVNLCSVHPRVQDVSPRFGLFQGAIIALYCTFVMASALATKGSCSTLEPSNTNLDEVMKYVGLAFTFISLGQSAFSTASAADDDEKSYNYHYFHFVFVLASFYMASILTMWVQVGVANDVFVFLKGDENFWVKIVSSWVSFLLYLWVLWAPVLFPDRDFS